MRILGEERKVGGWAEEEEEKVQREEVADGSYITGSYREHSRTR